MTEQDQSEQERARQLAHREVQACLSSLVSTLAQASQDRIDDETLLNLCEQAFELASPIQDYEEAAIQAGWIENNHGGLSLPAHANGDEGVQADVTTAQEACEHSGLDPYEREVYEFWAVSDWFGRKLRDQGEKVDFGNLTVWARTTTGQAIYCDGVVERIVRDLWKPEAEG